MLSTCNGTPSISRFDSYLFPRAPRSVEETGLPFLFLVELVVKVLFLRGRLRLVEISAHLKLTVNALDRVISFVREIGRAHV